MPAITVILKRFSDFIVLYWKYIIIFGILFVLLIIAYSATEKGKRQMYKLMLNLPIVGNMTKSYYLIKWARYMKLMI
jgi:type II secretory pathway component PulF